MRRKDCENSALTIGGKCQKQRLLGIFVTVTLFTTQVSAGTLRVWPSAVVVDSFVRISDLCEMAGFTAGTEEAISEIVVSEAPVEGGSRIVHMDMIRDALSASGANLAIVVFRGAVRCDVSRPAALSVTTPNSDANRNSESERISAKLHGKGQGKGNTALPSGKNGETTLRDAIVNHFNDEFRRYGGTANVSFDRRHSALLDLTDRDHSFVIRQRRDQRIGLTSLEVGIVAGTEVVQTVPMVVQVTMTRRVVAARRSINQGATVRPSDVHEVSTVVARLDQNGLEDPALAIGQRARRFISVGTALSPTMLEEMPLVNRGELVRVASSVGGVKVLTTAKAADSGLIGEVVRIRSLDNRKNEFDAVVIGPGQVEIAAAPTQRLDGRMTMRSGS